MLLHRTRAALFAKNFAHKINCVSRANFFQRLVWWNSAVRELPSPRDLLVGETLTI
jgi:hypothetical protein